MKFQGLVKDRVNTGQFYYSTVRVLYGFFSPRVSRAFCQLGSRGIVVCFVGRRYCSRCTYRESCDLLRKKLDIGSCLSFIVFCTSKLDSFFSGGGGGRAIRIFKCVFFFEEDNTKKSIDIV